jgi:hypothetical protein
MTEEEATETIVEGLSGQSSIPVKLRLGQGLDRDQLVAVKQAMRFWTQRLKGRPDVPKRIAAAFVDLQGGMQWGWDRYASTEQDEIEDAATELVMLAYEMLGEE